MTIVRRGLNLVLILLLIAAAWLLVFHPDWLIAGPPVSAQSAKMDDPCPEPPAFATTGRCADKCPNWSDTLLGFTDQGVAICKSAPTGCPYGDSIPLDSPKCTAPDPAVYNASNQTDATDPVPSFGK